MIDDLLLCRLVMLAYEPWHAFARDVFVQRLDELGFHEFHCWDHGDTQAYYCKHKETGKRVLAFRGTQVDKFRDVVTDLRFLKTKGPAGYGRVHRGFKNALDLIWGEVVAFLVPLFHTETEENGEEWDMTLVGHSLGGALATMAGAYMLSSDIISNPTSIVTWGAPRVGNPCFAEVMDHTFTFKGGHRRYVNGCDWVPTMPPCIFNYKHSGIEIYLDDNGTAHVRAPFGLRKKEMLKARWKHPIIAGTLKHQGYLSAMEKATA